MREQDQNGQSGRKPFRHQLRESEKQVKQLIDSFPVAMVISSGIKERVESVNDKFIELFGYTIEDMPDMSALAERTAHLETLGKQYEAFVHSGFEEREILALIKRFLKAAP